MLPFVTRTPHARHTWKKLYARDMRALLTVPPCLRSDPVTHRYIRKACPAVSCHASGASEVGVWLCLLAYDAAAAARAHYFQRASESTEQNLLIYSYIKKCNILSINRIRICYYLVMPDRITA